MRKKFRTCYYVAGIFSPQFYCTQRAGILWTFPHKASATLRFFASFDEVVLKHTSKSSCYLCMLHVSCAVNRDGIHETRPLTLTLKCYLCILLSTLLCIISTTFITRTNLGLQILKHLRFLLEELWRWSVICLCRQHYWLSNLLYALAILHLTALGTQRVKAAEHLIRCFRVHRKISVHPENSKPVFHVTDNLLTQ
jgi:hypothetical protein